MKASLKLKEDHHHHHQNPLLRVKVPISILNLPFISSFTAGDPKDLSFNLRSNFLTGPSLKLSYRPTTTIVPNHQRNPISLSLKSGVGLFGSPNNSPLIISAHFNIFGDRNPSFSLQIKPQFGDFFLSKTTVSSPLQNPNPNGGDIPKENGNGGFPYTGDVAEGPVIMRNIHEGDDYGFFSGVAVKARTVFPVAKCAAVKFRWGVNFPAESYEKLKLPFLTVDKISVERVEEEKKVNGLKGGVDGVNGKVAELEVVKNMCFWMRKEVEGLQMENSAIKESLEEMKLRSTMKNTSENNNVGSRKVMPAVRPSSGSSSGFENWKNKKNAAEENGRRELNKLSGSESPTSDVGEELKRAIMAASSNTV